MSAAGTFTTASSPAMASGRKTPKFFSSEVKYPDQPEATTAAPRASSSIRSQPMIQAGNSPTVA